MIGTPKRLKITAAVTHTIQRGYMPYKRFLTLPRLKPWDSEVLVRAQSISVLLKPSDEGVPSPLLR
ncbi:hypothetical protein, partial [Exiguobacterium sp. s150]|uniref:hypothetical protein n=1 Tax=Exiguobacterium sp. s150 TaxID=2751221 RepID=UPI001BEC1C2A